MRSTYQSPSPIRSPAGLRPRIGRRALGWLAVGSGAAALVTGTLIAPPDAIQGQSQRLMYLHVPAAWTAFASFAVVLIASIGYLARHDLRWDRWAQVAAEIGSASTVLAITIGSVWGHAVWGVWWAWDPRLVSAALMLVVYVGYLTLRRVGADPQRNARRAALAGIASFPLVPVVHFSVVWWRSLHQQATLLTPGESHIHPLMVTALVISLVAFTSGAAWVFLLRVRTLDRKDLDREALDRGVPPSASETWPPPDRPAGRATRAGNSVRRFVEATHTAQSGGRRTSRRPPDVRSTDEGIYGDRGKYDGQVDNGAVEQPHRLGLPAGADRVPELMCLDQQGHCCHNGNAPVER